MSCGVGHRHGLDPALAPIRPLAWEPPCAVSAALAKTKKKKKNENKLSNNKNAGRQEGMILLGVTSQF